AVLLTAPATTGGPSQPEETRAQAPGPASQPRGHRGPSQGEADRPARAPCPDPDARTRPDQPVRGGSESNFRRLRVAARSAEVRAFFRTSRSLSVMRSVSWQVSGRSRTIPTSRERQGARFGGVRMGSAARPETGKPAPDLAGAAA